MESFIQGLLHTAAEVEESVKQVHILMIRKYIISNLKYLL